MGGEKLYQHNRPQLGPGSPPHGRGKGMTSWGGVLKDRITPAWAGKSYRRVSSSHGYRDHPRMGGEKPLFTMTGALKWGSPPHGRGKD